MTLNYQLDRNDYLQHQLYTSSQSVWLKKENRKACLIYDGFSLGLSVAFYFVGQGKWGNYLTLYFIILTIIFLFFYPSMLKSSQLKNCERSVDEVYKNRFGQTVEIVFSDETIETKDKMCEAKLQLKNVEKIIEIPSHFYVKLLTGETLIVPKNGIHDIEMLRDNLKNLCQRLSVNFVSDLTWTWHRK
ncbi:MAG: YcxB family protein [Bacteroidota bacterium]